MVPLPTDAVECTENFTLEVSDVSVVVCLFYTSVAAPLDVLHAFYMTSLSVFLTRVRRDTVYKIHGGHELEQTFGFRNGRKLGSSGYRCLRAFLDDKRKKSGKNVFRWMLAGEGSCWFYREALNRWFYLVMSNEAEISRHRSLSLNATS